MYGLVQEQEIDEREEDKKRLHKRIEDTPNRQRQVEDVKVKQQDHINDEERHDNPKDGPGPHDADGDRAGGVPGELVPGLRARGPVLAEQEYPLPGLARPGKRPGQHEEAQGETADEPPHVRPIGDIGSLIQETQTGPA